MHNQPQYAKFLKPYARRLRYNMTRYELILWKKIRRKQLLNTQFLRQKPIGPYILDFYSKDPKLAIELDGSHHMVGEQKIKDIKRDSYLKELGIYTLRFSNKDILQNCEGVLLEIEKAILKLKSSHSL